MQSNRLCLVIELILVRRFSVQFFFFSPATVRPDENNIQMKLVLAVCILVHLLNVYVWVCVEQGWW